MSNHDIPLIAVVGKRRGGKTTLIRALTGAGESGQVMRLRSWDGRLLLTFVQLGSPQELRPGLIPTTGFPRSMVGRVRHDMIVCPFELLTRGRPAAEDYITAAQGAGYSVRVALISQPYHGTAYGRGRIERFRQFCFANEIHFVEVDATLDPNATAGRIRGALYP